MILFLELAQIEMKTPDWEKLFFLVIVERPKEAPTIALEKKIFEGGVVMKCWKKLQTLENINLIHCKRCAQFEGWHDNFEVFCGGKIDHIEIAFHCSIGRSQ